MKFAGALGAWLGAALTFRVFLVATVLIVVCGLAVLAWNFCRLGLGGAKRRLLATESAKRSSKNPTVGRAAQSQKKAARRLLPFAVPVSLATWCVLAFTELTSHL